MANDITNTTEQLTTLYVQAGNQLLTSKIQQEFRVVSRKNIFQKVGNILFFFLLLEVVVSLFRNSK